MARRDVLNYYYAIEADYVETRENAKELDQEFKSGKITQERYEQIYNNLAPDIQRKKDNYEFWSWVILLLNEPNKNCKKDKFKKQNIKVYDYLSHCKGKTESDDALKKFKEIMKEGKDGQ